MNEEKPWERVIIDDPHELLTDEKRKELLAWFEKRAKARLGNDHEGVKRVMIMSRSLPDHDLHFLMERIKGCREVLPLNIPPRALLKDRKPRLLDEVVVHNIERWPEVPNLSAAYDDLVLRRWKEQEVDKTKRSNRSPGKMLGKKKWWEK